ncbi:MAG: hypothetical protein ACJAXB_002033 [Candidatus Endobugula sp.]|jgi:uncharacterized protein with ParB-like and HNH nuclease domain
MERQTTIKKLFHEDGVHFAIPAYQRAYAWEVDKDRKQVAQFITDIKEQNPKKKYFLGHFLFEKDEHKETKFWVIDGQQRLTTVVIFFTSIVQELEKREKGGRLYDLDGDKLDVWRINENYIRYKKQYKFETVRYDNSFFTSFLFEKNEKSTGNSSSAQRIKNAKAAFDRLIQAADLKDILTWKKVIDDAVITTFEVPDKVQATQIFAFQNDRGKDLTTLEKLKAFLMHKLYAVSEDHDPESQIRDIEDDFSKIYERAEQITLNEDQVLNYHNIAHLPGSKEPIANVKDEIDKIPNGEDKEYWIKGFVHKLRGTFDALEEIEKKSDQSGPIADLLLLDSKSSIPLLIKLYYFHKEDDKLVESFASSAEKILFKLQYKTADYRTNNLHIIAKHYDGDIEKLQNELSYRATHGFQNWWDFNGNCRNYFNGSSHYSMNIKYILWKYENYLRVKDNNRARLISPIDFKNKFQAKRLENTTDHITPRNPRFTEYSPEFINTYLNDIGNLVLMVWGDNSEKKNHNPVDKVELFDSEYYSHKEIRDVLLKSQQWGAKEIEDRKAKILEFIFKNWELT